MSCAMQAMRALAGRGAWEGRYHVEGRGRALQQGSFTHGKGVGLCGGQTLPRHNRGTHPLLLQGHSHVQPTMNSDYPEGEGSGVEGRG